LGNGCRRFDGDLPWSVRVKAIRGGMTRGGKQIAAWFVCEVSRRSNAKNND